MLRQAALFVPVLPHSQARFGQRLHKQLWLAAQLPPLPLLPRPPVRLPFVGEAAVGPG